MCNSCNNHRTCCCCTSPASCNRNGKAGCGVDDCRRFVRSIHHWYPGAQNPKRCACCQKLSCKTNDLLHHLCPVPGIRGETMKQILLARPPKPSCCPNSTAVPQPLLTFLQSPDTDCELESSHDSKNFDDQLEQRLIEKLNSSTTVQKNKCKEGKKNQCKDLVEDMNNWYAKKMKNTLRERDLPVYYTPGAPRKHKRRMSPRNSLLNFSYYTNPNKSSVMSGLTEESESNTDSDRRLSTQFSIIQVNPEEPSEPEEVDEKVAIEDLRNLLKEVQNKPLRPILFHSPFNRDKVWTWRNYDPTTDVPAFLPKKAERNRSSEYSMWTMTLVQNLIAGHPVTDKKIKTNKELGRMVNQLATELKRRNETIADMPEVEKPSKKLHHRRQN